MSVKWILVILLAFANPTEGPNSPFTDVSIKLSQNWSQKGCDASFEVYESKENPIYMAIKKVMVVNAPIERVAKVFEDFDSYKDVFRNFAEVKVLKKEKNKIETYWEHIIPVFFLPNVKYETVYNIQVAGPKKRSYRYQLKKGDSLKHLDGSLRLEEIAPSKTCYYSFDFSEADWGPVRGILGTDGIIKTNIKGMFISDVITKVRMENPEWPAKKVIEESEKRTKDFEVDDYFKARKIFPDINAVVKHIKQNEKI